MRHKRKLLVAAVAAVAATAGGFHASHGCAADVAYGCATPTFTVGDTANVWVNGIAGASPARCAVACTYDSVKAYSSLDTAYQAASPGDTIKIQCGNYGAQQVFKDGTKNTSPVTFTVPSGSASTCAQMQLILGSSGDSPAKLGAAYVTFDGLDFTTGDACLQIQAGSDHVTVQNSLGCSFNVDGSTNVLIQTSTFGPCTATASQQCVPHIRYGYYQVGSSNQQISSNVTIKTVTIHDITTTNDALYHTDGLAIFGSDTVLLDRVVFYNNQTTNIRVQQCCNLAQGGGATNANLTIQNSWFGIPWFNQTLTTPLHDGFEIDTEVPGLVVRGNSFSTADSADAHFGSSPTCPGGHVTPVNICGTPGSFALFTGNIYAQNSTNTCWSNTTFKYNQLGKGGGASPATCDATETATDASLSSHYAGDSGTSGSINLHLTGAGWGADDFVPTSVSGGCAPTDYDGTTRPVGTNCDAGSDER